MLSHSLARLLFVLIRHSFIIRYLFGFVTDFLMNRHICKRAVILSTNLYFIAQIGGFGEGLELDFVFFLVDEADPLADEAQDGFERELNEQVEQAGGDVDASVIGGQPLAEQDERE